jgi:hypothetical protein
VKGGRLGQGKMQVAGYKAAAFLSLDRLSLSSCLCCFE